MSSSGISALENKVPAPEIRSFPAVSRPDARILILGSMPGEASLKAGQYYAHPQNQFWTIMGELLGAGRDIEYPQRLERLLRRNIALWDVLACCRRAGSLDSAIKDEIPNDFTRFFAGHPDINRICFNGRKAESAFRRLVLARGIGAGIETILLPSTSPAHAGWSLSRKREVWGEAILDLAPITFSPQG